MHAEAPLHVAQLPPFLDHRPAPPIQMLQRVLTPHEEAVLPDDGGPHCAPVRTHRRGRTRAPLVRGRAGSVVHTERIGSYRSTAADSRGTPSSEGSS